MPILNQIVSNIDFKGSFRGDSRSMRVSLLPDANPTSDPNTVGRMTDSFHGKCESYLAAGFIAVQINYIYQLPPVYVKVYHNAMVNVGYIFQITHFVII